MRLFTRAESLRTINFVSLFSYWGWPASIFGAVVTDDNLR
jgi:hypothetical protein